MESFLVRSAPIFSFSPYPLTFFCTYFFTLYFFHLKNFTFLSFILFNSFSHYFIVLYLFSLGYGLPVAKTLAGQIASIFYIMFGIPIFLIILKDVGRLLSRSFRKFYKRSRSTGKKFIGSIKKISISMKVSSLLFLVFEWKL